MVSLWPWRTTDGSPASFEKTLSTLSDKIAKTSVHLDTHRARSRRFKALWTLYTSFGYLLYAILLALVVGYNEISLAQWGGVIAGPLIIWAFRFAIASYFNYRISSTQANLDSLQKQRDATIEKLKIATKYNSTQELLNKYGGSSPSPSSSSSKQAQKRKGAASNQGPPHRRTGLPPPPTANIPGRQLAGSPAPSTPSRAAQSSDTSPQNTHPSPQPLIEPSADFAPNAFSQPLPYPPSNQQPPESKWYDRFLDVLLGEDETLPRNRLALICANPSCRRVNGQAPPGTRSLEEIGRWRCGSCAAWNGLETDAKQVIKQIEDTRAREEKDGWKQVSRGDEGKGDILGDTRAGDESDSSTDEVSKDRSRTTKAKQSRNSNADSPEPEGLTDQIEDSKDGSEQGEEEIQKPIRKRGRPKGSGKKS